MMSNCVVTPHKNSLLLNVKREWGFSEEMSNIYYEIRWLEEEE